MRIVRGKYKGRRFYPPQKLPTRPTTDFAKEGLFNILENNFDLAAVNFLDLFCGTGNISYEFASRNCEAITSVDIASECVQFIKETTNRFGIIEIQIIRSDVMKYLRNCPEKYKIIFAGPPYAYEQIESLPDMIIEHKLLEKKGWFILEHSPKQDFQSHPHFKHHRNYGKTIFSIFTVD